MKSTRAWILAVALSLPIAAATAEPAKASASVSLSYFYDSLSNDGDWFVSAEYGHVWRPYGISASWRPYSDGRWVYSDVGWTFVSYSSWGWGPYHYGRWTYDPYYGWVWVPGTEWAPAWVTFYEGPGWIGWAPLPPRVSYVSWRSGRIDPRAFCFVESRYFLDSNVNRRIAPLSYNTRLVRSTRDISRFSRHRGAVVNAGPSVDRIEKATNSRVRRYRLSDRSDVSRASNTRIRGDAVEVFRPQVTNRVTHLPKVKEDRTKRGRDERVQAPDRGRSSTKIEQPRSQAKPTARKPAEQKPPVVSSTSQRSSREIHTPAAKSRDSREIVTRKSTTSRAPAVESKKASSTRSSSRDTSKYEAPAARSKVVTTRVERDPRRTDSPSTSSRSRQDEKSQKVSSRSPSSNRSSVEPQRADSQKHAKVDQPKAREESTKSKKEAKQRKSSPAKRKPSSDKPPHG